MTYRIVTFIRADVNDEDEEPEIYKTVQDAWPDLDHLRCLFPEDIHHLVDTETNKVVSGEGE